MFTRIPLFQKILEDDSNRFKQITSTWCDLKVIQQINFSENVAQDVDANTTMFFIIKEAKETILDFSQETVTIL